MKSDPGAASAASTSIPLKNDLSEKCIFLRKKNDRTNGPARAGALQRCWMEKGRNILTDENFHEDFFLRSTSPSGHRSIEYATICACKPEPRNGVRADGSGRLSRPNQTECLNTSALFLCKRGRGIPARRMLPALETQSYIQCACQVTHLIPYSIEYSPFPRPESLLSKESFRFFPALYKLLRTEAGPRRRFVLRLSERLGAELASQQRLNLLLAQALRHCHLHDRSLDSQLLQLLNARTGAS